MESYLKLWPATLLFSEVLLFFCKGKELKFDKDKWIDQADPVFPPENREKMINYLTKNYRLVGPKYSELIQLLGKPDYQDSQSLSYKIVVKYNDGIDPIYSKNL